MNNSTYKSLLQNGRLHDFPSEIKKNVKDYYEYVSKRVEDNNRLVDNQTASYYNTSHIMFKESDKGTLDKSIRNDPIISAKRHDR